MGTATPPRVAPSDGAEAWYGVAAEDIRHDSELIRR